MLETLPTSVPFLPPIGWNKRIDSFDLRDARQQPIEQHALPSPRAEQHALASPHADGIREALARLSSEGLAACVSKSSRLLILGGTGAPTGSEIPVFEGPFMISLERDGTFLALVSGPGDQDEEARASTLSEATDAILRIYRRRGLLGGLRRL